MWSVGNGIHAEERSWNLVYGTRNSFDVVDRAKDVARVSTADQLCLLRHESSKNIAIQLGVLLIFRSPPLERALSPLRELYPGGNIRLVVQ